MKRLHLKLLKLNASYAKLQYQLNIAHRTFISAARELRKLKGSVFPLALVPEPNVKTKFQRETF